MTCFALRGAYPSSKFSSHVSGSLSQSNAEAAQARMSAEGEEQSKQSGVETRNVGALSCTTQLVSSQLAWVVDICPLFRRSSQSTKRTPYVEVRRACPPVCDLVSVPKPLARFS
jgi:hypothetical protein